MTNCRRGDVVLVWFPDSNLRTAKRRPALVVQSDELPTGPSQTIVAMITSNLTRSGHPSRILIQMGAEPFQGSGLLMDSVVMTDNLATVHLAEIDRIIGRFPDMGPINKALQETLAIAAR
jgi:mRNA interferase MazF